MIFYKRFIGDIQSGTGHLSCAEMGVYDRLLDHYYVTEAPLPGDVSACCRIARAMDSGERKAVVSVLSQFFELKDGNYHQARTDKEIGDAQPKIAAAKTNGAKGGRPKKDKSNIPDETKDKPSGLLELNQSETETESNGKASHSQSQIKPIELTHTAEVLVIPDPMLPGQVCAALRKAGIQTVNPSHPDLLALIAAGASIDQFTDAAAATNIKKFAYILGVVKGQREQAASKQFVTGKLVSKEAWRKTPALMVAKAKELGIGTEGLNEFQLVAKIEAKLDAGK